MPVKPEKRAAYVKKWRDAWIKRDPKAYQKSLKKRRLARKAESPGYQRIER